MKVYIDDEYKCHVRPASGYTEATNNFFDGKCDEFIEGYRFVPQGSVWVNEKGYEFVGEMLCPWKPYGDLQRAQSEYEHEELGALKNENEELMNELAALIEDIYQEDLVFIEE